MSTARQKTLTTKTSSLRAKRTLRIAAFALASFAATKALAEPVRFYWSVPEPRHRIWTIMVPGHQVCESGDIDGDGNHDLIGFLSGWRNREWPTYPAEKIADDAIVIEYGGPDRRGLANQKVVPGNPALDETHLAEFSHDDELPGTDYPRHQMTKLGIAVACDDMDLDGFDDVIFLANDRDPSRYGTELYIYFGGPCARGKLFRFEDESESSRFARIILDDPAYGEDIATWPGDSSDVPSPIKRADLCTVDLNADTLPDIAVTMYRTWQMPEIVIIYGQTDFRGTTRAMSRSGDLQITKILCEYRDPKWEWDRPREYPWTYLPGDYAPSLSSGDMNGDGIDDLVIGDESVDRDITESSAKLSEDGHPLDRPGAVYVLYGPLDSSIATLDLATPVPEAGEVVMFGAREGWPYNGGNANGIGRTVALGDVNQDGYDELMFGATSQNTALDWAILYQFPGSPFKPGIPTGNGSFVHLDPLIAPIGSWNETRLGWHEAPTDGTRKGDAAWGDVSGDGRDDFVDNFAYVLLGYMGGFRVVPTPEIAPGERLLPPTLVEPHSLGDSLIESTGGSVDKYISQQDIDGDGETDVVLCNGPAPAWFLVALSDGGAPSAMAVERYTGGKTAMRGFGGRLSPVLRVNIGFEDGQAGAVTATLNKSGNGITNIPEVYVGPTDCYWHLTTDRVGYTQANLLFRYIESDLLGLPDDALVLLTAPTLAGPWNPVARQQLNAYGRRVSAQVSSLGYFTLAYLAADETDAGPRVKEIACDTCTDNPDNPGEETMTVRFAQAVTGVDESDFAVHAPASVGGEILEVHGTGKEYKVRVALGIGVGPVVFEVLDDDSIRDIRDRPLGGPGAGNGSAQRETCAEINIPVSVDRIDADDPSPNALPIVSYTVHFTAPVSGVDIADFELDVNELDRVFFESISGTGDTYHVGVYTGKGSGTIRLRLRDDDTILDASGTPLGGQGTGNGDAQGPTYVILRDETDLVPPTVRGITRASVSPTSAVSVDFYVEFTEDVVGVELSDFEVVTTGGISGAAITGIRGDALVSVITVSTGDGDGTIQLRLHDDDSIVDLASNPLGGAGIGNGDFLNGHVYTIYKSDPGALPPVVSSITRLDASPTDAFTVRYRVRFSEPVTNVDAGDFVTTTAGLLGSSVDSVTGAGDDYTVTVDTGNGAGTLRLDVRDNDSIFDADRNPLGGIGNDNGHFTSGEVYEILRETMMSVRSVKNNATVLPGGPLKVKWTSGPIGNHVRIELWKSGERVAILEKKTKNDGSQNVAIPGNVAEGGGYIIRVVSTSNSAYFSNMKKPFTIE